MPSMFRSPNDPSSSVDSSENSHVSDHGHDARSGVQSGLRGYERSSSDRAGSSISQQPGPLARASSSTPALLPNLAPHQAQGMLYVSLLHDVCRKQALELLNEGRDPDERFSEDDENVRALAEKTYAHMSLGLMSNVDLPPEMTGSQGADVRTGYVNGFQDMVRGIAASTLHGLESTSAMQSSLTAPGMQSGRHVAPSGFVTNQQNGPDTRARSGRSLAWGENNNHYLSPQDFTVHHQNASGQLLTLGDGRAPFSAPRSVYMSEYQELELLGKGGYGQVYRVRNHLDNQEYAIKKILITSRRLQKSLEKDQVEALLAELRTLAKLNHTNIVRYFHGWIETVPSSSRGSSGPIRHVEALDTIPSVSSFDDSSSVSDRLRPQELTAATELGGDQGMERLLEEAQDREEYEDDVVFGFTSKSGSSLVRKRRASHATTSSTITLKTSVLSVGEEDDQDPDIETIPRQEADNTPLSHAGRSAVQPTSPDRIQQTQYLGGDATLFIKMSLHPTTLSTYLSSEVQTLDDNEIVRHCFHKDPSIGILSSIVDGVEYLHSQRIVHRDLKPANIFLSIHYEYPPSLKGCVDITACSACNKENKKRVFITPCIGDFGLIAEIGEITLRGEGAEPTFEPSPLSALYPKPVGTQFYRPPAMPRNEPIICPRLDVYSLGVMAMELVHKFGTKSERAMVLSDLNKGVLPKEFMKHEMAHGIMAMTESDRDQRWDCADVRQWLAELGTNSSEESVRQDVHGLTL